MSARVTRSAQGDEVLFDIVSEQAALPQVMHLEFTHSSAILAAPAISPQYFLPQFLVCCGIQPKS